MSRKVLALILVAVIAFSGTACAARRKASKTEYKGLLIPSDAQLPEYDNPVETDIAKGKIHVSFKGAFRAEDEMGNPTDWVYFVFRVKPQEDMRLAVEQSEAFDGQPHRYMYYAVPKIGEEHAFSLEIIAGVSVPVLVGVNMPVDQAGELPSVSRITITFNKESMEFRNVRVEEWEVLEGLREGL